MKKIITSYLILFSTIYAKSFFTILPHYVKINYDNDSSKSLKKEGTIIGSYFSMGNWSYLLEFDYSKTDISFKDSTIDTLHQNDLTLTYAKYYRLFMLSGGIHHINTSDTDLGDGDTYILGLGGYIFSGYDKYSYGIEGYYTKFNDAHDENYIAKSIDAIQYSPYFRISKAININTRNNLNLKANYINIDAYNTKNYTSYEIENILYYKKFYTSIKAYIGEMKTGVSNSGFSVTNSKYLVKNGYSIKLGYYILPNLSFGSSYSINTTQEVDMVDKATNSIFVTTIAYSF